jgi:alkanesulfonate monooxygenase SsuD/methylene tetrahydromethanopterin reductase-like flavin-dependent oxidoreductase (luciferase family)
VRLGTISLWGPDLDAFRHEVRLAEELGYEVIGIGDTPFAWHELYSSMFVAAGDTTSATLAPMVATPFVRHPVADAGGMSALFELTGGRAVFVLGSGGSVPLALGRPPATAERTGEWLRAMRALLSGESTDWDGDRIAPMRYVQPVPLFMSCSGPKALRVGGQVADGIVLSIGSSQQQIEAAERAIGIVRASAEEAGRDPGAITFWANTFISIEDTREEAIEAIMPFLASTAAFRIRPKHRMEQVPPELRDRVVELQRRYDVTDHVVVGGSNANLVRELGLADYLAGVSCFAGTAELARNTLAEYERIGVSCITCALPGNAKPEQTLRRLAEARDSASTAATPS